MSGLTDADFDLMHHAVGRPDGRHVKPYRNYFAVDGDSPTAARFRETGVWREGRSIPDQLAYFAVTESGIEAMWEWLAARQKAKGLRHYRVWADEVEPRVFLAKSRAAARYALFLQLSDAWSISFQDFVGYRPRVEAA